MPSSCEMKDEPAFHPLQGNLTFFRFRESRYPLHVRQHIQGSSHIPIAEGSLLLRCLWEGGLPLYKNPGNQLTSRDDMGCRELSWSSCCEIGVPIDLRRVSQGISEVVQRKPSQLSSMMGNGALHSSHSRGFGRHFKLILATPSDFTFLQRHQCPSRLLRDFWGTLCSSVKQIKAPYLFDWEQGIALHAMQGNRASSLSEGDVSWFFSS